MTKTALYNMAEGGKLIDHGQRLLFDMQPLLCLCSVPVFIARLRLQKFLLPTRPAVSPLLP